MTDMPKPFRDKPYKPFVWKETGLIGIMSDLHIPYHDEKSIDLALSNFEYIAKSRKKPISAILLNGDSMDCAEISDYIKRPGVPCYREEAESFHVFLKYLRKRYKKAKIIIKMGNHEYRIEKYLLKNAPALYGSAGTSFGDIIGAANFDCVIVSQDQRMEFGQMNGIHGHEFGESRSSPINPAKTLWDRSYSHAFCGHHHHTSSFTKMNIRRQAFHCYTIGCLSVLSPAYKRLSQYNHGAALLEIVNRQGEFNMDNFRIDGDRIS